MLKKIKTTIERLRHDAAILEHIPKFAKKLTFDMGDYGSHWGDHRPEKKNYCGTSACALGVIALSGESGLKGVWCKSPKIGDDDQEWVLLFYGPGTPRPKTRHVNRPRNAGPVAQKYYGITIEEECFLFAGVDGPDNPQAVARRIRLMAAMYEAGLNADDRLQATMDVANRLE